jgi:heme O synthase-like polyprenyltransferase
VKIRIFLSVPFSTGYRRGRMDIARKLSIGIVMIIPGFVFGGLVWEWLESWLAVAGLEITLVVIYALIISGRSSGTPQET